MAILSANLVILSQVDVAIMDGWIWFLLLHGRWADCCIGSGRVGRERLLDE